MPSHRIDARTKRIIVCAAACALLACARAAATVPASSGASQSSPTAPRWVRTAIAIPGGTFGVSVSAKGVVYFGRFLVDSLVRVDAASGTRLATHQVGFWPYDVSFNRTGALAYTTHLEDSTIGVVNTRTGAQVATFHAVDRPIRVQVATSDTLLFVTTVDGRLLTMRADDGNIVRPPTVIGGVLNGLALTPNGARVWVSNTTGYVQEIDAVTGAPTRNFVMGGRPQDIAISRDGRRMYISNEAGWVGVYDARTLERLDSLDVDAPFGIALNPAGTQLWVASSRTGTVHVFFTANGALAGLVSLGGRPRHIAFSSDGTAFISNESNVSHLVRETIP